MSFRSVVPILVLGAAAASCSTPPPEATSPPGASTEEPDTARVPQDSPPAEPLPTSQGPEEIAIIQPGEVVPAFKLTSEDGTVLDSTELVGHQPFVMVFFASWCKVCERKLPELRKALKSNAKDILVIGVALDNPETWDAVGPYVKRHEMSDFKLVNGQANRRFATAYNPFGSVPVIEVIDRSGVIAELQRGWKPGHGAELEAALAQVSSAMLAP